MNFLGQQPEQKLDYDLPSNPPSQANEVIISDSNGVLSWDIIPNVSNSLHWDVFHKELALDTWLKTTPSSPAAYNCSFQIIDAGVSSGLWSVCDSELTHICRFTDIPGLPPITGFPTSGMAGGGSATSIQHLYKQIDISTFNEPFDITEFHVNLGSFGDGSNDYTWQVFVTTSSVPITAPVYDADYAIASGQTPFFDGEIPGRMQLIKVPLKPSDVCNSQFIHVVLQARMSSRGFISDQWITLPSVYGLSAQRAVCFGQFLANGTSVSIPENAIKHSNIQEIGVNSHAALDAHKADMESKVDQDVRVLAQPSFNAINIDQSLQWPSSDVSIRNQNNTQILYTVNSTALSDRTILTAENVLSVSCQAQLGSIVSANSIASDLRASNGVSNQLRVSMKQAQTIMYDANGVQKMQVDASGVIMADALQTVAIKPVADNIHDIGTPLLRYKDVHVANTVIAQNFQIGVDANLVNRKCVWMHFIAFQDLKADHVVKIVDHLGVAKIDYVGAADLDSTGVLGVTVEDILNGSAGKICIGGIFKAVVQNGFTINIGDMLEKSDLGGNDGRFLSNPPNIASPGRMGVALSSATGNLLGTQFVYGTFLKNEAL